MVLFDVSRLAVILLTCFICSVFDTLTCMKHLCFQFAELYCNRFTFLGHVYSSISVEYTIR
jgi:hypothetical protein